ncbi:hypothetical protein EJ110_NYTH43306 [Nymphaea thermarum]|nr:hypothetical protein EJ110_NYTH43306 [Nymphaea thermarum]
MSIRICAFEKQKKKPSHSSSSRPKSNEVVPYNNRREFQHNSKLGKGQPIRYLTPKQIEEYRRKGLCYRCEGKWHKNHQCTALNCIVVIVEPDPDDSPCSGNDSSSSSSSSSSSEEEVVVKKKSKKPESQKGEASTSQEKPGDSESLHSMQDPHKPNSMRVFGRINGHKVLILLDNGATNNFLTEEAAKRCNVALQLGQPQTIIVGGGYRLKCLEEGKDMEVIINKRTFKIGSLVIPFEGVDLVLGMTWFLQWKDIHWQVKNFKMTFIPEDDGEPLTLQSLASNVHPKAALRAIDAEQPACWVLTLATDVPASMGKSMKNASSDEHVVEDVPLDQAGDPPSKGPIPDYALGKILSLERELAQMRLDNAKTENYRKKDLDRQNHDRLNEMEEVRAMFRQMAASQAQLLASQRTTQGPNTQKGEATTHYLWFDHKTREPTWENFKASFQLRFGESTFIDYDEDLKKLVQVTTVPAYHKQFIRLASRIQWIEKALIGAFKGGLKKEVLLEMQVQNYDTLEECFAMARICEVRCEGKWDKNHQCIALNCIVVIVEPDPEDSPCPGNDSSSSSSSSSFSEEEVVVKKKSKKPETQKGEASTSQEKPGDSESLHSMQDPHKPNSMRVFGRINGHKVLILLDNGATNNFLTEEAAKRCNVALQPGQPQKIIVGGVYRLKCLEEGKDMKVVINKRTFKIDSLVIPLEGVDLVLGMTWFLQWKDIHWQVKNFKMMFIPEDDGEPLTLQSLASNVHPKAALRAIDAEQPACWVLSLGTDVPGPVENKEEPIPPCSQSVLDNAQGQAQGREGESVTDQTPGPDPVGTEHAESSQWKRKASDLWARSVQCAEVRPRRWKRHQRQLQWEAREEQLGQIRCLNWSFGLPDSLSSRASIGSLRPRSRGGSSCSKSITGFLHWRSRGASHPLASPSIVVLLPPSRLRIPALDRQRLQARRLAADLPPTGGDPSLVHGIPHLRSDNQQASDRLQQATARLVYRSFSLSGAEKKGGLMSPRAPRGQRRVVADDAAWLPPMDGSAVMHDQGSRQLPSAEWTGCPPDTEIATWMPRA